MSASPNAATQRNSVEVVCDSNINQHATVKSPRLLESPYGYVSFRQLTVMKLIDRFSIYVSGLPPQYASVGILTSHQWYVNYLMNP